MSSAYLDKAVRRERSVLIQPMDTSTPGLFDEIVEHSARGRVLERFHLERDWVVRTISKASGRSSVSRVRRIRNTSRAEDLAAAFDASWLRSAGRPACHRSRSQSTTCVLATVLPGLVRVSRPLRDNARDASPCTPPVRALYTEPHGSVFESRPRCLVRCAL